MQSLPVDFSEERGLMAMVLSGFYVIFPLVRVHPLVSQVNQLIDVHVRLIFGKGDAL